MHWRDEGLSKSYLENENGRRLARVFLAWGDWVAETRSGQQIGRFETEEDAKAVTLVTIRMEQADRQRII